MKVAFFSSHNFERDSILKANNNHHKMVFIEEMLSEKTVKLAKDCKAICIFINDNSDALVLKKLNAAHKALAELKGLITSIPNQNILIEMLALREAKESSAIENIISTMDELYQNSALDNFFLFSSLGHPRLKIK